MGKRIFWIFIVTVVASTTLAVMYLQSESFALLAKGKIQRTMARDLGLAVNFDRLRIGILPPSLSLVNVDVKVKDPANRLGLSTEAVIRAESVGFSFRMIQAFSRGLAINKIFFSDGKISMLLPKGDPDSKDEKISELVHRPIRLSLGDGFFATIRQLEIKNTEVDLSWREKGGAISRVAVSNVGYLALTPDEQGTNLVANLERIEINAPKVHENLKALKVNADFRRDFTAFSTLDVQRADIAFHAAGKLTGNIDDPLSLKSDIDLILRGPVGELADFDQNLGSFRGEMLADVKLAGSLREPAVKGKVEIDGFRYSLWELNKLRVVGSYASGFLTLDSLDATQGAGKVALRSKVEIPIPFKPESKAIQLQLENAKFEEFAGDLKKDVNNLRMTLSGRMGVNVDFAQSSAQPRISSVMIRPELEVHDLELNNQTYNRNRVYKKIFSVKPFQLSGAVAWRPGEVRVHEGTLQFASGKVDARGTVTNARGFDLSGTTDAMNFGQEVGDISGIPLQGIGAAKIHVHGPPDNVILDFDLKQREAKFLDFDFGEVEGRVTYDEKNSRIYLTDVKGRKNASAYTANGNVNVGEGDDLDIDASFAEGDPNDIFAIFAKPLRDISWLPRGMGGTVSGTAKVGGHYNGELRTLAINGRVKGKNLSYRGEIVHEADLSASLAGGVLKASILNARKYETPVQGAIEYKLSGEMKYFLGVEKGKLRSLDFVSASGFPLDGIFSFRSEGQGKWETLESRTIFELRNAFVRTRPMSNLDLSYATFSDHAEFLAKLGSGAEARARISRSPKAESTASLKIEKGNFDYMLCALSRRNCAEQGISFLVSAEMQSNWKGESWQSMSGSGSISELELGRPNFRLKSKSPIPVAANVGEFSLPRISLEGEQSKLNLRLVGKVDGSHLDAQVQGDSSLRILEFLTPFIEEARGRIGIALGLTGSVSNAKFRGNMELQDGFLRISGLDAPVDGLGGRIKFADSRIQIDSMSGQLGGGSLQASGSVDLFLSKAPRFDVDLFLANNRVKFVPVNYAEISDGKLSLTGDRPPYLFGGTVRMKRVMMRNNFDMGSAKKGPQNARYLPEKIGGSKSFYEIRIRAIAENGVTVDNNLLNAEFRGEATLLNNFEFPQVVARAELVRGKLLFRNTAFTLDHAYIRAPNQEYFNPQFSIGGIANVDNYRISLFASGTIEKPKITLSSYPSMPQEDIVSLLAFGYRGEDARKVNPNDTSAITYSEVGSILLEQIQLNQNLQSKGLRVTVVPSLNENEASIIRPKSSQTASPKVYLQTQLLKNLEAAFGGTVGSTQGQSLDARLEYRVGRKASVSAVYEQTPALDATELKNSYGADLKFRWGFK